MPKRQRVELESIAGFPNLSAALYLASKGKRQRSQVRAALSDLDGVLNRLSEELLSQNYRPLPLREFVVHDPKRRVIHAPDFRDRIVHHAIILQTGGTFDRALIDNTYACRKGKGPLLAVRRVQAYLKRYPWFFKADVRSYFHSIQHEILKRQINNRFKGEGFQRLMATVIDGFSVDSGVGLPIGALTSQVFANHYLNIADRFMVAKPKMLGYVRYMDDIVGWAADSRACIELRLELRDFLGEQLKLTMHHQPHIQRSESGMTFGGFRVFPDQLRLSHRRKIRYLRHVRRYEQEFARGHISALQLQQRYMSAHALMIHANCESWLKSVNIGNSEWVES
jgi:RNA-directed DNA polymerase